MCELINDYLDSDVYSQFKVLFKNIIPITIDFKRIVENEDNEKIEQYTKLFQQIIS